MHTIDVCDSFIQLMISVYSTCVFTFYMMTFLHLLISSNDIFRILLLNVIWKSVKPTFNFNISFIFIFLSCYLVIHQFEFYVSRFQLLSCLKVIINSSIFAKVIKSKGLLLNFDRKM